MDFESNDADSPPISASTAFPPPPRVPTFIPRIVSTRAVRAALTLVADNPTPTQTSVTVPALRVVRPELIAVTEEPLHPSTPPSMPPPPGSTPIRQAA